jgi:hypothetical protein
MTQRQEEQGEEHKREETSWRSIPETFEFSGWFTRAGKRIPEAASFYDIGPTKAGRQK